jgi:ubiquinone/menaquinone biosynthesis C-methylase UbiE/DNA-binding transcriptional ArsR family regulator
LTPAILDHMSALADPTRCRMLVLLEKNELTVSELCAVLQMPQSSVSRHLKTLADDSWVVSRRDATSRFYSMSGEDLDDGARQIWPIIRAQLATSTLAEQDEQRLKGVLARRRAKSEQFFATAAGSWDRLRESLFGDTFYLWAVLGLIDTRLTVGDLGCGTGQLSATIAPHVSRIIAVDASTDMLDAARERLAASPHVEVRQGQLEALPMVDGELDAAVLSLVLHYAPDPVRALSEAARVVRPGGRLLVVDMQPHERVEYQQQMGHVWLGFSEKQIDKLLSGAGFGDLRMRALPVDRNARGPALFAAVATRLMPATEVAAG